MVNHKLTAYIPSTNKFVIKKISYEEIQSVILPNEGIGKNFLKEEDEILFYTASLPKCCKEKKNRDWDQVHKEYIKWCRYFMLSTKQNVFCERQQKSLANRYKQLVRTNKNPKIK